MPYKYKIGFSWLPQMGSSPFPSLASSELDDKLMEDYRRCLPRVRAAGFDYLIIYGLIGEHGPNQMPADLKKGFSPARDRLIRRMIDLIHHAGLKFLVGLGVYSWGFMHIIKAHPEVAGQKRSSSNNNSQPDKEAGEIGFAEDVMCGANEESWRWQEQAVRFILERYDIDGFHLESADRGRCMCPQCGQVDAVTYHARINARTTRLIKEISAAKIVGVNSCGIRLEGLRDLPAIRQMSTGADYFIDYRDRFLTAVDIHDVYKTILDDRPAVVRELAPVAFGTFIHLRDAGLERSAWFLPAPRSIVKIISDAYRAGCKALEYYALGAFDNAGHELNNYIAGYALNHPEQDWQEILELTVERLYQPKSRTACQKLAALFSAAEMSCLYNGVKLSMDIKKADNAVPYLGNANAAQRRRYQQELECYLEDAGKIKDDLEDRAQGEKLMACLAGTLALVKQSI